MINNPCANVRVTKDLRTVPTNARVKTKKMAAILGIPEKTLRLFVRERRVPGYAYIRPSRWTKRAQETLVGAQFSFNREELQPYVEDLRATAGLMTKALAKKAKVDADSVTCLEVTPKTETICTIENERVIILPKLKKVTRTIYYKYMLREKNAKMKNAIYTQIAPHILKTAEKVAVLRKKKVVTNIRFICDKHTVTIVNNESCKQLFSFPADYLWQSAKIVEAAEKLRSLAKEKK